MSKQKTQKTDLRAAESWKGKIIRDVKVNQLGLVIGVRETKKGLRLRARFPGDKKDRLIALEPTDNLECIVPGMVKARYRPPRQEDLDALKARRAETAS